MPGVCDFYVPHGEARWYYPCRSFDLQLEAVNEKTGKFGLITHTSVGGWAACDACHDAIEEGRLRDVLDKDWEKKYHEPIGKLWAGFLLNRFAEAVPIEGALAETIALNESRIPIMQEEFDRAYKQFRDKLK